MAGPPDPNQLFTVLISTRSFLKFLNSHVVSTTTIACESLFQHMRMYYMSELLSLSLSLQVYVSITVSSFMFISAM